MPGGTRGFISAQNGVQGGSGIHGVVDAMTNRGVGVGTPPPAPTVPPPAGTMVRGQPTTTTTPPVTTTPGGTTPPAPTTPPPTAPTKYTPGATIPDGMMVDNQGNITSRAPMQGESQQAYFARTGFG